MANSVKIIKVSFNFWSLHVAELVHEPKFHLGSDGHCRYVELGESWRYGVKCVDRHVHCLSAEGDHGGYVEVRVNAERGDLPAKAEASALFILEYVKFMFN